jgi:selenide, water dikinase
VLLLTKPLGTGIVGTAIKHDRAPAALVDAAVASMTALNKTASEVLRTVPGAVHACTDVTGFGLLGHASVVARASGVSLVIRSAAVPVFDGVLEMAGMNRSAGLASNREAFAGGVSGDVLNPALLDVFYDPQTSGGLLAAVRPEQADDLARSLKEAGVSVARIGEITADRPPSIRLV